MDHETAVANREISPRVAASFQQVFGLDDRPETLGEWAEATASTLDDADVTLGVEEMCLTDESPHEARVGDEVEHFACVLDTLLLPFLRDEPGAVEVRSRSPVSEAVVEATVSAEDISVSPDGAVMSFGVTADPDPPAAATDALYEYGYANFCPYIRAFADEAEYEEWAADTPDAATMALPLTEGFELARRLARRLSA